MKILKESEVILFDLDGTLLPLDFDELLNNYFGLLTKEFSDLVDKEKFVEVLMTGTEKMIKNNGKQTNQEIFLNYFLNELEVNNKEKILDRINKFYQEKFPQLGQMVKETNQAAEMIKSLDKDYKLILATNPVFPKQAIIERLKWINVEADYFSLLTSYENMHYAKPNPKYYQEIFERENLNPEECIMVGNDMQHDMVAKTLGCKTFLVEDFLINREDKPDYDVDWRGDFKELLHSVQ